MFRGWRLRLGFLLALSFDSWNPTPFNDSSYTLYMVQRATDTVRLDWTWITHQLETLSQLGLLGRLAARSISIKILPSRRPEAMHLKITTIIFTCSQTPRQNPLFTAPHFDTMRSKIGFKTCIPPFVTRRNCGVFSSNPSAVNLRTSFASKYLRHGYK
jgi:hypothetical protein